mmetsp:Transcript_65827/g.203785  ORF Transcript_65827/g.203785 Transcript_65827/m.203785 type:complete len:284 (-) Transcript_65827:204-1055(-)
MSTSPAALRSTRSKPAQRSSTSFTPCSLKILRTSRSPSSLTKRQTAWEPAQRWAVEVWHLASTKKDFGNCSTMDSIWLRTYWLAEKTATFTSMLGTVVPSSWHSFLPMRFRSSLTSGGAGTCVAVGFASAAAEAAPTGGSGGAVTSLASLPPAMKSSAFLMVVLAMFDRASCVRKALCGVTRTLGNARSRANFESQCCIRVTSLMLLKSLKKMAPSLSYTSRPQALMTPLERPSMRASVSMRPPRETLTRITPGFILAMASLLIIFAVVGSSGTCRLMMSALA